MAVLFTGATIGLYFQPPALRAFFGATGLKQGGGSSAPIAVPPPAPQVTPAAPEPVVVALGRLRPEGDAVVLAPPFGSGDARGARIFVTEGDTVTEGQVIAELDSLPQYEAALALAKANRAAREAALVQARAAVDTALAEARANRDRAASAAVLAEQEAARQRDLFTRGVTRSALDRAEAAAVQAARDLDRATAQLDQQAGGEDQPDIAVAASQLDVARADLAPAEVDLARARVSAPMAGQILALHVRPGEKPGAPGIAALGATDRMEAELEVYQTDIARVAPGRPVTLSSPALADPLTGTVSHVGLEVERQSVITADPAANTDALIVRVTVQLDPAFSARASTLTGLEVTGRIITGDSE